MTKSELKTRYFDWMCRLVYNDKYSKKTSYRKLLCYLDTIEFTYILPLDDNRAEDGVDLRYRFGYEFEYDDSMIASYLDDRPCSVLEMMIALAMRCEETIMVNPDYGDRMGQWFWNMIVNLGLGPMTDAKFDKDYVDEVIDRFLNRDYAPNGEGGLFTVDNPHRDMRSVEIWYQMCWYLDENL